VRSAPEIAESMAALIGRLTSNTPIAPTEARLRLGGGLDAAVARCKGSASCIAGIGRRLECDEVILVGVSQLGDLILVLQRIETRSGAVASRLADTLDPGQRLDEAVLTSYLQKLLPPSDFRRFGRIVLTDAAEGDAVFVDGAPKGKTPIAPITVPAPGRYTIKVTRPGHFAFVTRLEVPPDSSIEVTPTLTRKAAPTRWYQNWWVWAILGGVVAAGATAGAVVATSRSPEKVPAVIHLGP
jgi:hypothetical protein